jgi:RNase H-fold protein (predicted Holliday junction resolvase)
MTHKNLYQSGQIIVGCPNSLEGERVSLTSLVEMLGNSLQTGTKIEWVRVM